MIGGTLGVFSKQVIKKLNEKFKKVEIESMYVIIYDDLSIRLFWDYRDYQRENLYNGKIDIDKIYFIDKNPLDVIFKKITSGGAKVKISNIEILRISPELKERNKKFNIGLPEIKNWKSFKDIFALGRSKLSSYN